MLSLLFLVQQTCRLREIPAEPYAKCGKLRPDRLDAVLQPLYSHPEFPGVTISDVRGFGHIVGRKVSGKESNLGTVDMIKLECVVHDDMLNQVVTMILEGARTGNRGDGKIIVTNVRDAIRISTGKHGPSPL
ncbi:MAG TPA: P-II family nitrogen regulator [Candidatus Hydrogenedentes bacterium]|nr:P-II family nitrogen regulator [Candidatus Hydrogenedentota bacterium]